MPNALDLVVPGLGTAVGLAGSIYGGIKAGQERRKMDAYLNGQKADNESWFNKNYYSDYTQRADTQALMKNLRDTMKKSNSVAANSAAVTGATPEASAVAKEQSNKVVTDTMSRVAAQGQAWKDNIQNQYMNRKNQLSSQEYGNMSENANSYEALMGNGIKQIGNAVNGFAAQQMTPKSTTTATTTSDIQASINGASDPKELHV